MGCQKYRHLCTNLESKRNCQKEPRDRYPFKKNDLSTVTKYLDSVTCHHCMTHMCRHHIAPCPLPPAARPPLLIQLGKQGCAGLRFESQHKQFFFPPLRARPAPPSAASSVHLFPKRSGMCTCLRVRARVSTAMLIKFLLQCLQLLRVLNESLRSVTLKLEACGWWLSLGSRS